MKGTVVRQEQNKQERAKPMVGPCDDLHILIAKRAFELYQTGGCRDGHDLEDWLEAERDILSQVPSA
jgi:hypothetical protein